MSVLPTSTALVRGQLARRRVRKLRIAHGPRVWLILAEELRVQTQFLVVRVSMSVLPTSTAWVHGRSVRQSVRKLRIVHGRKLSRHLAPVQFAQ
jgi:hypothetical protein